SPLPRIPSSSRLKNTIITEPMLCSLIRRAHSRQTATALALPPGLPIRTRDVGDFLALLANRAFNGIAEDLLTLAASYVPESIVVALKIYLGVERYFGHLNRSDHTPFWKAGIPSIMWTDTSEFRNPHYHLASDKPRTLDCDFMREVAKLVLARVVSLQPGDLRSQKQGADGCLREVDP